MTCLCWNFHLSQVVIFDCQVMKVIFRSVNQPHAEMPGVTLGQFPRLPFGSLTLSPLNMMGLEDNPFPLGFGNFSGAITP